VRLEEVHPEKEPSARPAVQPRDRLIDNRAGRPFVGRTSVRSARQGVTVCLESLDQAEAPVQRKGGDEGAGGKPGPGQAFGQRRRAEVDADAVVPRAVPGGVPAGHDARVRGQRDRRSGVCAREPRTARRQAVHCRRSRGRVAIHTHAIGPQRVDRDEEQVLRSGFDLRRAC